ncbi:hypothetical protein [Haloarchaeobius sp. HRN-SO-5]
MADEGDDVEDATRIEETMDELGVDRTGDALSDVFSDRAEDAGGEVEE